MDSITQATIGAAVGHAVLGKKMGNKAVMFGAFAGTVPDLDFLTQFFLEHDIYTLVYHRGLTHSILFTLVMPPIFAWLTLKYYKTGLYKKQGVQIGWGVFWSLFYAGIIGGLLYAAIQTSSPILYGVTGVFVLGIYPIYKIVKAGIEEREKIEYDPSFWRWTIMYGLGFMTHWLIDSCTAYGTQIFEPFSNYRVAFNNIAIMDPAYTVPMIIGLIGVVLAKEYKIERRWNYVGIAISTLYLGLTFVLKSKFNNLVERNLQEQNIAYVDYMSKPTILNTVLWQTTVKGQDAYYYATYSFLEKDEKIEFTKLPMNHEALSKYEGHEFVEILKWFAKGYYNVTENEDGSITFNNLLFGLLGVPKEKKVPIKDRYVFTYKLEEVGGELTAKQDRDFDSIKVNDVAKALWEGIQGKQ